jgi:hypothetical protein
MSRTDGFVKWVTDSARTGDELFTVELLLERMRAWQHWPFRDRRTDFQETMRRQKERRFNPGYRPALPHDELEALEERADTVTHFMAHGLSDRPLRDLAALRFFPALQDINISGADAGDLSPLAGLHKLTRFRLAEESQVGRGQVIDLAQIGEKPVLNYVDLLLAQPWPDVRALGWWPALRELIFHGNLLVLEEVESFPALETMKAQGWNTASTPLRDLSRLPAMPRLKRLTLEMTATLGGIARYPTLLNLGLGGPFTDLTPLEGLENVTCLRLTGENFSDLRPLTLLPKLRELVLVRERSIDLSPLTDAHALRRVSYERCAFMQMEVAALNAGLPPEAEDFLAEEPRPLGPLKFYSIGKENEAAKTHFRQRSLAVREMREQHYAGDLEMEKAEARAFLSGLHAELTTLLGRGWGLVDFTHAGNAGGVMLNFKRYQDSTHIREIVQLLRERSARWRMPWTYMVLVEPHGDMSYEMEQLRELEKQAKNPEGHWLAEYLEPEAVLEENEESARRYREKYELLEREHSYELQKQQGITEAELPPVPEEEDLEGEEEVEEQDSEVEEQELLSAGSDEDEGEGGVAIAPPPPAPPDAESLSDALCYAIDVYEDCMTVNEHLVDRARYGLGEAPVEWTG